MNTYKGIEIVSIPSGMGGVLPAAVAMEFDSGEMNVICLHDEYFPNWVFTTKREVVSEYTYPLTASEIAKIEGRLTHQHAA